MKKLAGCLLGLSLCLTPCSGRANPPEPVAAKARGILQAHCASCHGGGKAVKGGFGFVLDRDLLVNRRLVVPGKTSQSDLFLRIQQGEMPPANKGRLSAVELKVVENWIAAGAPLFDRPVQSAKMLTEREVAGAIRADLDKLEPRRRRFTRYLTLTHLAFAGRPEKDLQTTREAAGKLLNSLSWHPRLSLPEPLADGTILRLDLRAYKWNAPLWEKLATVYPYRFDAASAEARAITAQTGTDAAAVRADWFVATVSRPPLYHDLLQLPQTDRALERLLQVDVPGNIQEDNVLRAGFNDSGVSKNNRLIERHDAAYGALWRSYDFANNTGRQNLFEHPLGPNTGAISFQAAGGEMIFHLPNGLQGYLLFDAQGRRIDKAPNEIVADPRRPDQRVETGISCMSCHARGLLPKVDQLRGYVEKNVQVFNGQILAGVRALHPRPAQFQAQVEDDNVRYLKALQSFGVRDPDDEPVNRVTQRFEATLDGRTVAAEAGLTVEQLGRFLKQDPALGRLLGGALVAGGTVQREVFQENFPELARRLEATTVPPDRAVVVPFQGHAGTVNCVVFSPDGAHAASGSDDGTIRLWEVATGKERTLLEGNGGEVNTVAFSAGKLLLSGGRDRLLRLWELPALSPQGKRFEGGKPVRVFHGHTDVVRCVAVSPDGKRAVSGGDDRTLRVWDIAGGQEIATLAGHTDVVTSVVWSQDGKKILSGSRDGTVRWWDLGRGKQTQRLEGHAGPVLTVALTGDGKALSGGNDRTMRLWDLATGKELHSFQGHANAIIHLHVPAAGVVLSSSSQHRHPDRTWRRWDLTQRKEIGALTPSAEISFGCAAFSPNGRQILAGGPGGFLRLWSW